MLMSLSGLLGIISLILTIVALVGCVQSAKPTNTKLLWIVIIIIAPLLGSLLWLLWGKDQA
jgi:hypothetical protein